MKYSRKQDGYSLISQTVGNNMPSQIFSVWRAGKSMIVNLIIQSRKKDRKLQNYFRRNDKLNLGNVEDFHESAVSIWRHAFRN